EHAALRKLKTDLADDAAFANLSLPALKSVQLHGRIARCASLSSLFRAAPGLASVRLHGLQRRASRPPASSSSSSTSHPSFPPSSSTAAADAAGGSKLGDASSQYLALLPTLSELRKLKLIFCEGDGLTPRDVLVILAAPTTPSLASLIEVTFFGITYGSTLLS